MDAFLSVLFNIKIYDIQSIRDGAFRNNSKIRKPLLFIIIKNLAIIFFLITNGWHDTQQGLESFSNSLQPAEFGFLK